MRGDRPLALHSIHTAYQFTPHARGSTPYCETPRACLSVYPACAGIDRCSRCRRSPGLRLPRMRGDRPIDKGYSHSTSTFTPHARGSTQIGFPIPNFVLVYPACAGIDLKTFAASTSAASLPRMRGDRPSSCLVVGRPVLFTPHARGSTSRCLPVLSRHSVYPACAGIDPLLHFFVAAETSLPRMRGDRPCKKLLCYSVNQFTPHARGSTVSVIA